MRLMSLEKHLEEASAEEEEFEDARPLPARSLENLVQEADSPECLAMNPQNGPICIPPTIPECDDCDE